MERWLAFLLILSAGLMAQAVTVDRVIVRQQYPWTETVKVEYVVSGVTAPVDIVVSAEADGVALDADRVKAALKGDVYGITRNGAGTIEIDPAVAMGVARASIRKLNVTLSTTASADNVHEVLYRIFDLNDGSYVDATRADFLNGKYGSYETDFSKIGPGFNTTLPSEDVFIWTGVTNNPAYKTDKLVMRRIRAKDKVWASGGATKCYVKMTFDYLISVFETTQAQWTKIYGENYSTWKGQADSDGRPAEGMMSGEVIGFRMDDDYPYDRKGYNYHRCYKNPDERFKWPLNTYLYDVDSKSFLRKMWDKTGFEFFLPTRAQWEFACRAGTTTDYNSGKDQTEDTAKEVGWVQLNSAEGYDKQQTHVVGTKPANAFGLYDMHGNVAEMTAGVGAINAGQESRGATEDDPVVDPLGTHNYANEMKCGGCYDNYFNGSGDPDYSKGWKATMSYSASSWEASGATRSDMGFRMVCPMTREWGADRPRSHQPAAVVDVLPATEWSAARPTKTVVATTDQPFPRTVLVGANEAQPMVVTVAGTAADGVTSGTIGLTLPLNYTGANPVWGHHVDLDFSGPGRQEKKVTVYCNGRLDNVYAYYGASSGIALEPLKIELYDPVADACLDGVPVMRPNEALGAHFLMRDVVADGGYVRMDGWTITRGIRFSEDCESDGDVRRITGRLEGMTGADRALTLLYAVPLPAGEIVWWDDPRRSRTADPASLCELCNVTGESSGHGPHSKWPIAAVTVGGRGIGIGIDPLKPAYHRFALNPKLQLLYIAYDLALASPERDFADVSLCVFDFPAAEGFRGALEKYRSIYPDAFVARVRKHGSWVAFNKLSTVPGGQVEDFRFRFNEYMWEPGFDDEHDILSLRYKEPCTWWMKLKDSSGGLPSYDECLARAEELSRGISRPEDWETEEDRRNALDGAQTWLTSVFRDRKGLPAGMILDKPWCHGIAWSMNAAPGIPCPPGGMTEYSYKQSEADFERNYGGKEFPQGVDGEYVDSSELACTVAEDYDRSHFAAMRSPLTFSADGHRPVVFKGLSVWDYCEDLSRRLRARNRILFANATPNHWSYLTPLMDAVGIEIGWGDGGEWNPAGAEQLLYWRAVAGDKPYCLLMTNGPQFTREMTEKYMKLCLAYALLPGFQSNYFFDGAGRHERDRDLWRKYMPLICRLSEAGWRPVNRLATVTGKGVVCEQFGTNLLTVYNHEAEGVAAIRLVKGGAVVARELVSGRDIAFVDGEGSLALGADEVAVLEFPDK